VKRALGSGPRYGSPSPILNWDPFDAVMEETAQVYPGPIAMAHLNGVIQRLYPRPESVRTEYLLRNHVIVDQYLSLWEFLGNV
jgi:hypothetical protein